MGSNKYVTQCKYVSYKYVTMYECKLVHGHSEMKKNTFGKTIDEFTNETYEDHFASCSG